MPYPHPLFDEIPTDDGKSQKYKAAGKLRGKNAIITGGDSGIGRATAVLFAMEGANSLIAYLAEEEDDARDTKKRVEQYGQQCHLLSTDLRDPKNCREVVDEAVRVFGGKIDILFNNAAYQMVADDISQLSEYVPDAGGEDGRGADARDVAGTSGSGPSTPTSIPSSICPSTCCRT